MSNELIDFVIVSDDMEWVKQNIIGDNIYYSDFYDEIKDFCLLTSCDHNINTNSTFSWWGAWLANSGKVVAPSMWFGPNNADKSTKDLYLDGWDIV